MKAIIVNRIGDFGVYMALLFIIYVFRSLDFGVIFSNCAVYADSSLNCFGYEVPVLGIIGSCIFLGTVGKSAQIGLHLWLPDAMEGPTPVSALLHAATMVTAGVFILIRFSTLFAQLPNLMLFVGLVGGLTSIFAGISACVQYDIKKIIAYSTCSHLGLMLLFCGMSHYDLALFHLFNHAFFKALLFLSAGSVIHALGNEQDVRKMGGLATALPFTYCMFFTGSLSLIGFPFMSGFYSKDVGWEILVSKLCGYDTIASGGAQSWSVFFFILFNVILCLSVLYSFRLIVLTFSGSYNGFKPNLVHLKEPSLFM